MRYGYRRLTVLLKREDWNVSAKRIYRLYTEEGSIARTKKRRSRAQRQRVAQGLGLRPNQKWSMDSVAQRLPDGRWIRMLTVVDQFTRECVTLLADNTLSGEKVAAALDKVLLQRGAPESITVDNAVLVRGLAKQGSANNTHVADSIAPKWFFKVCKAQTSHLTSSFNTPRYG